MSDEHVQRAAEALVLHGWHEDDPETIESFARVALGASGLREENERLRAERGEALSLMRDLLPAIDHAVDRGFNALGESLRARDLIVEWQREQMALSSPVSEETER